MGGSEIVDYRQARHQLRRTVRPASQNLSRPVYVAVRVQPGYPDHGFRSPSDCFASHRKSQLTKRPQLNCETLLERSQVLGALGMTNYRRRTFVEQDKTLRGGGEYHSKGISVEPGEFVTLTAHADRPFYAGLFTREEYFAQGGPEVAVFPFEFGTDRLAYTARRGVGAIPDDLFVVIRAGVFTGTARVHVKLEKMIPIVDED